MMTPEQPFDPGILDSVTRESVESTLMKSGSERGVVMKFDRGG